MTSQSPGPPGEETVDAAHRADGGDVVGAASRTTTGPTPTGVRFALDADGRVASWPDAARDLYGYEAVDLLGRGLDALFAEEGSAQDVDALLDAADRGPVDDERWHGRADGSEFWGTCTLVGRDGPVGGDPGGYAVVVRDTTAHRQYERSLERQNDRLKEFTDILSHDLRTPLAVIDGRLDLYRETGEAEHLDAIEETVERMERLVEDLLRVARQGQLVESPEPTDIETVLGTAREGTLPASATCSCEPVPWVVADPDRLCELFENLLRNAVEHGSTSPRSQARGDGTESVTVRVGPLDDGSGFYVEDDGPGIPEDYRERVFDHGFTTRDDGTGYGLSVVRSIVGAHGWDVAVTDAEGGGARFEFTNVEFVG
jgi:PAS domain S-box-containing protein